MRYLIILLLLPAFLQAQDYRINGSVRDNETDAPLIGANVILEYTLTGSDTLRTTGAATDANGRFTILMPECAAIIPVAIQTMYIGYERLTLENLDFGDGHVLDAGEIGMKSDPDGWCMDCLPPAPLSPIIRRDKTNFQATLTREDFRNLPTF